MYTFHYRGVARIFSEVRSILQMALPPPPPSTPAKKNKPSLVKDLVTL